jgi:hypothetical protein
VEPDDELLLIVADVSPLDVGPEVVQPPQTAALAAPPQAYKFIEHMRRIKLSTE